MYAFMSVHDVCIVRFYVFIHVITGMRMYGFMPILCCMFKTVYCRCFRDMYIDFDSLPVCVCIFYG